MPKVKDPPIVTWHEFKIYATRKPSKTGKGKDRVWIQVRQSKPKTWRIAASLNYVNGFDVRFEK